MEEQDDKSQEEADILRNLNHPNIVKYIESYVINENKVRRLHIV